MANYVFAYSGGNGMAADEAERNAQMAKWGQWFGELGSAVVDGGAPTGTAKTVGPGGSVSDGGSRALTGYSIVSADSLDSAVDLAKGCPVLENGGADSHRAIVIRYPARANQDVFGGAHLSAFPTRSSAR